MNEDQEGRNVTAKIKTQMQKNNKENWLKKPQHVYLSNSIKEDQEIDQQVSCQWLKEGKFTSHVEGFLCAIQEQEINTSALQKRREKDHKKKRGMLIICRWCGKQEESILHIIAACSYLSSNLYLHSRHNPVAKEMYNELVHQLKENENRSQSTREPQTVTNVKNTEIWWDKKITTQKKIPHNKPDLVVWNNDSKQCKIIDVSIPLDTNVKLREQTKRDNYIGLIDQLQRVYPMYKYSVIPVILELWGPFQSLWKQV